jgi:hypothetical protein
LWHQFEPKLCIVEAFEGVGVCTFFFQHCQERVPKNLQIWVLFCSSHVVFLDDPVLHLELMLALGAAQMVNDLAKG